MMLTEETGIQAAALPIAYFREHLKLGSGFTDADIQDSVLESFLRAAIAGIEARTGKILIAREFAWRLTAWRDRAQQALPVAPVNAIASVTLIDRLGGETVADPATYRLEPDAHRPLLLATGAALPAIADGGAVRIVFDTGYGPDFGDIPPDLGQAVLLLAAHYYEFRNETGLGDGCMPFGVTALIERYRQIRMGARA